ncbi:unnamed protein product [Acanthoscelides obtectus]|uniref:Rac GTPase-activating protein 1 n=1 Tax=Acanthoscelides obtectus TaxID=200917 RepID=A0A9P0LRH9_ACAOB|nr:unnamed protein product [Acanthoscelides obtectus]CAK1621517.1 Rac GTPase-activating protein 1 [Acanthoscelides obtectus]
MASTPFKKPLPCSSSTESLPTSEDGASTQTSGDTYADIPLVPLFDDLMRKIDALKGNKTHYLDTCINLAEQIKFLFSEHKIALLECRRLLKELDNKVQENSDILRNLQNARTMLDNEKRKRRQAEKERDNLRHKFSEWCISLLRDDENRILDKYREEMVKINIYEDQTWKHSNADHGHEDNHLRTIPEINSTGSILSDLSYSRSEDDLDSSYCKTQKKREAWKTLYPTTKEEPASKKRRSSSNAAVEIGPKDTVRATTTLTVPKHGPITATSIIESLPQGDQQNGGLPVPPDMVFESWAQKGATPKATTDITAKGTPRSYLGTPHHTYKGTPYAGTYKTPNMESNNNLRQHCFQQKTAMVPETCLGCNKRIKFSKRLSKCKDCKCVSHPECQDLLPLPCVPSAFTPNQRKIISGTVGDYAPLNPPMVPALIVHCLTEIEQRGLNELGLYRIPGSEKDVRDLKDRFLNGKGSPNLKDLDIHVLCSCVKDFLRSLSEPLVTHHLWKEFAQAVTARDERDVLPALYHVLGQLPRPNRDTLAFLMLHLQKVAESPECKMPLENLVRVFGPTLMRYSSDDQNLGKCMEETEMGFKVVERMIQMPTDYWLSFVNVNTNDAPGKLQQTPSTDSLLRPNTGKFLTPRRAKRLREHKNKFSTPPFMK